MLLGIITYLQSLYRDRRGVTAVEYGLILALIAGVIITAVSLLGTNVSGLFASVASKV